MAIGTDARTIGLGGAIGFFYAVTKIEIATVQTIAYATPLFVTALSVPLLKDRVGLWRWGRWASDLLALCWSCNPLARVSVGHGAAVVCRVLLRHKLGHGSPV